MTDKYELGYMGKFLREYEGKRIAAFGYLEEYVETDFVQQKQIPDVSFWQGNINFDVLVTKTDSLIIRAGQGTWMDTKFIRNVTEALARDMVVGVYWFYDDRYSPKNQADTLIATISTYKNSLKMPIIIDWENTYNGGYGSLRDVVAMMELVEASIPNLEIGIYTGYYWWIDHSSATSNPTQYAYLKDKPLWLAWWTSSPAYVKIPAPWTDMTFWQYGTPVIGEEWGMETKELDMSWFNGTTQQFYDRFGGTIPEPPPSDVVETKYTNGVYTLEGNLYGHDYRTIVMPFSAIKNTHFYADGNCKFVDNFVGDLVYNFTPSEVGACVPNMGVRSHGGTLYPYLEFNPYIGFYNNKAFIMHQQGSWNTYPDASQGYRYIIEGGHKALTSSAWDLQAPRRLIGRFSDGTTVLISSKGREDTTESGWTLHQAAEYGLSLGLDYMIDADGGKSVRDILRLADGTEKIFSGTGDNEPIPVIGVINFLEGLVPEGTDPPPPPPPPPPPDPEKYKQYKYGKLKKVWIEDTYKPSPLELVSSTGVRYIPKAWANKQYYRILRDQETTKYGGNVRNAAPAPAVWVVGDRAFQMTKKVQYFCADLLSLSKFSKLYSNLTTVERDYIKSKFTGLFASDRAFTNKSGFPADNDPTKRANYIKNQDTDQELPRFDKIRVCSDDIVAGVPVGDYLKLDYFSTVPFGYNLDILEDPRVFRATIIQTNGHTSQFPQLDGKPVYVPLMSNGDVFIPLEYVEKVA